jgi:hypothetical protein
VLFQEHGEPASEEENDDVPRVGGRYIFVPCQGCIPYKRFMRASVRSAFSVTSRACSAPVICSSTSSKKHRTSHIRRGLLVWVQHRLPDRSLENAPCVCYTLSAFRGGVVQLVRTPACHAGGRGFESRRSRLLCRISPRTATEHHMTSPDENVH